MSEKARLLILDDDESIRTQMKWAFAGDYDVTLAADRPAALDAVRAGPPDVACVDLGLPPDPRKPTEGFHALAELLELAPECKAVVITGQDEKENALEAIERGAYDFLCKPVDIDELRVILRRGAHVARLERENRELRKQRIERGFEEMLGASPRIAQVFESVRKVATSDTPVLVRGETGTGKELVARAIHRLSPRAGGPFVAINCGGIPANLLESELFGHEKGAFTDAHSQRKGRVEMAQGGTLFLDEIGELSRDLQVSLLRFLQEHVIQRVGGRKDIPIDARLIAATNVDLEKAITEKGFRDDLYYRLSVVTIPIPPLRDREGDAELLAKAFLHRYASEAGKKVNAFSKRALAAIRTYSWPGNVRELENRVKRAVIMSDSPSITPEDLELGGKFARHEGRSLREVRNEVEREMVLKAVDRHRGNLSRVASELGISRPTLYELMDKHDIRRG